MMAMEMKIKMEEVPNIDGGQDCGQTKVPWYWKEDKKGKKREKKSVKEKKNKRIRFLFIF